MFGETDVRRRNAISALALAAMCAACAGEPPPTYDLVVANGRVIDPASGLDGLRHVGIRGGRIDAISTEPLTGHRVIDASRHVVSPGFIDLHEHGQQEESYRMMVRDGVTSAFELEVGTGDVAGWYGARQGGQIVNYGVSVGHIPARMKVLGDPGKGLLPAGIGGSGSASDAQQAAMEQILRQGLADGAVAVGFGSAYTPGAPMPEIERMFRVAAAAGASAHIHMRGGIEGLRETIAAAKSAGVSLHIVHVNSSAGSELDEFLAAIQAARDAGQDVTTEAYPYGAGMTEIQSALFDDWKTRPDERFGHGKGHPRTSGTFAKVLGKYVRDEQAVTLMDALRRMTIEPARRLERRTPAMERKGRMQIGADADLTIFDPATIADRATYEDATVPSAGIPYVIVGGQLVVDAGQVTTARPGRAIRAPLR
jgi:N-acyl-D-aspartate/D-glutamate deacylase